MCFALCQYNHGRGKLLLFLGANSQSTHNLTRQCNGAHLRLGLGQKIQFRRCFSCRSSLSGFAQGKRVLGLSKHSDKLSSLEGSRSQDDNFAAQRGRYKLRYWYLTVLYEVTAGRSKRTVAHFKFQRITCEYWKSFSWMISSLRVYQVVRYPTGSRYETTVPDAKIVTCTSIPYGVKVPSQ